MRQQAGARGLLFCVLLSFGCGSSQLNGDGGPGGPCAGDETKCSGTVYEVCINGRFQDTQCANPHSPRVCDPTRGCVACIPGQTACVGNDVHSCNADGTLGGVVQTCQQACVNGGCPDPCSQAAVSRSYIGCEYWPVDLDNAIEVWGQPFGADCTLYNAFSTLQNLAVCQAGVGTGLMAGLCDFGNDCSRSGGSYSCAMAQACVNDAQHSPFAIVVSNPSGEASAGITLSNGAGMTAMVTVAPRAVVPIFPQMLGFPDQSLDYSGIENKAYKLVSSIPIVAYQFNPLNNVGVFSNDASLLIPVHTFDTTYVVLDYPTLTRRPTKNDYNAYVTIVAAAPGSTNVQITPTARVRAGTRVPALPVGQPHDFTLQQFETLNLEAEAGAGPGAPGDDLTGTRITGDKPFGVFVGHEAANLSNMNPTPCCADHLEEQLFPASTWGKKYAIARAHQRAGEPDFLRILALRANTTVTFNPPAAGSCPTLNAGQKCDVFISGDVEVQGSDPILIGHMLLSTGGLNPDSGDPSLSLPPSTEQYRKTYTFLVPMQYNFNYVSLVASGRVTLDGADVSGMLAPFGSGTYKGGRIQLQAGQHQIDCPDGCGIEVYGWSEAVSYMFAGGLDLKQIVVP